MLASQRQEAILAAIRRHGAARVADLVESLGVSDMTVRRDIGELARRGLVLRVHGGAVDARRAADEPGFRAKAELFSPEKAAIAAAAVEEISPGGAVALSAGTTTHLVARLIAETPALRPLTVVTNSLPAAEVLHQAADPDLSVVLIGGTRTPSDALVGPVATHALETLRVDVLFLGVHGIDLRAGLTTPNLLEAETDRALVAAAGRTVVVADHSKWGVVGLARIVGLADVDLVITDQGVPTDAADAASDTVDLVLVPARGSVPSHPPADLGAVT